MWDSYKKGFKAWLQLEKSLADNSVAAYMRDLEKLTDFLETAGIKKDPGQLQLKDLETFIRHIHELGMTPASQSRIISGIKSFYKYCIHLI